MTDRELEARLRAWYRAEADGDETAPISLRREVAAIPQTPTHPTRRFRRGRGLTLLAAAALLLVGGAVAAGSGVVRLPSLVPPEPVPSPAKESSTPTAVISPAPTETSPSVPATAASWMATGTMGTPRYGYAAVRLLDGRVLVAGGSGGGGGGAGRQGGGRGGGRPRYAAKKVELTIPDEIDISTCHEGDYGRWSPIGQPGGYGPFTYGKGQHDTVYIVDVEGTRWVIDSNYLPGTSKSNLAELEELVASIQFEP